MKNKITVLLFLLFIGAFTLLDLCLPDRVYSESERRNLKQRPELTLSTLLSGEFSKSYEDYLTDQFAPRDIFVKAKYLSDRALGKTDSGGVYITADSLYSVQSEEKEGVVDKSLGEISRFAKENGISTSLIVVPSSAYVYRESLPAFAPYVDESELFSKISQNIGNAQFLDIADKIYAQRENYIYFRTDHHWTTDGALIAYNAFMGSELVREDFEIEKVSDSFLGTLSSKSGAMGIDADVLEKWTRGKIVSLDVYDGRESTLRESMYFDSFLEGSDKYSYYLGQNQPLVRIKTESSGGRLIIFKDSYAHSFSQLCVGDWSEIVLVDLRYVSEINGVEALLEKVFSLTFSNFDRALFLYSADTFTTQYNMLLLNK